MPASRLKFAHRKSMRRPFRARPRKRWLRGWPKQKPARLPRNWPQAERECIIIGADTAVELDGEIFGKPRDAAHAREMLAALSGRTHHVLTGIFLLRLPDGATRSAVETRRDVCSAR